MEGEEKTGERRNPGIYGRWGTRGLHPPKKGGAGSPESDARESQSGIWS